jgi:hypothetical protein
MVVGVTTTEARVLIDNLLLTAADLRDLAEDERAPLHLSLSAAAHINAVTEAAAELARVFGVSK